MLQKIVNNYRQSRVSKPDSYFNSPPPASSASGGRLQSSKRVAQFQSASFKRDSNSALRADNAPPSAGVSDQQQKYNHLQQQQEQQQQPVSSPHFPGETQYLRHFTGDESSSLIGIPPQRAIDVEYETVIASLTQKIKLLLGEIAQLTKISNQLMDESTQYQQRIQELTGALTHVQNQQQQQQQQQNEYGNTQTHDLRDIELRQSVEHNRRLERQLQGTSEEANFWRERYEILQREYERDTRAIKEQLSQKHETETEALRAELVKLAAQVQTMQQQVATAQKGRGRQASTSKNGAQKENITTTQQSFGGSNGEDSAVWVQRYIELKREKDQEERALLLKIRSLEEQVTYLQFEANGAVGGAVGGVGSGIGIGGGGGGVVGSGIGSAGEDRSAYALNNQQNPVVTRLSAIGAGGAVAVHKPLTASRGALAVSTGSQNSSPDLYRVRNDVIDGTQRLHFEELNDYFRRNTYEAGGGVA